MTDPAAFSPVELLTFRVADQEYALPINSVREIRGWARPTPLPGAPHSIKGVINLRGVVLPVMGLADRLGTPAPAHNDRDVIIVVSHDDTLMGLLVDAVSDIVVVGDSGLQPPPDGFFGGCVVSALALIEDRMIRLLDLGETLALPNGRAA